MGISKSDFRCLVKLLDKPGIYLMWEVLVAVGDCMVVPTGDLEEKSIQFYLGGCPHAARRGRQHASDSSSLRREGSHKSPYQER